MADDPTTSAPSLQADQFPVVGDEVFVRAQFRAISHKGCHVSVESPNGSFQLILVDGAKVFCPLRVAHVLETYGQ